MVYNQNDWNADGTPAKDEDLQTKKEIGKEDPFSFTEVDAIKLCPSENFMIWAFVITSLLLLTLIIYSLVNL